MVQFYNLLDGFMPGDILCEIMTIYFNRTQENVSSRLSRNFEAFSLKT